MDNKTKALKDALKAVNMQSIQSARPLNNSNTSTFSHGLLPRPTSFQKKRMLKSQMFSKDNFIKKSAESDKKIQQENIRLLTRLIQIKHQKSRFQQMSHSKILKRRQNPQRSRSITLQNKRLGSSLIRIRAGKNLQKVKTEISEKAQRMLRKKMAAKEKPDYNLFFQERKSIVNMEQLPGKTPKKEKYRS